MTTSQTTTSAILSSRAPLANAYGRFTEGFDTPDLADARALLAER